MMENLELLSHVAMTIVSIVITAVVLPLFRLLVELRDAVRDLRPKMEFVEERVALHHDWLVGMRASLGYSKQQQNKG